MGGRVTKARQEGMALLHPGKNWEHRAGVFCLFHTSPILRQRERAGGPLHSWDGSPGWSGGVECGGGRCEVGESPAVAPAPVLCAECSGGLNRPQAMGHRIPVPALPGETLGRSCLHSTKSYSPGSRATWTSLSLLWGPFLLGSTQNRQLIIGPHLITCWCSIPSVVHTPPEPEVLLSAVLLC